MDGRDLTVVLDLATLPDKAAELERAYLETRASAATVMVERLHGRRERTPAVIGFAAERQAGELRGVVIDERSRASHADPLIATEQGAEGVAILTAHDVLGRVVFARLPKTTGADYKMRDPRVAGDDRYERLECSGIGGGRETTARRLDRKLAQLARYPSEPCGYAIVTNFGAAPIEIYIERIEP